MFKSVSERAFRNLSTKVPNIRPKYSLLDANQYLEKLRKSGRTDEAKRVFDEMPNRDEFTWNTMLSGFAESGRLVDARILFDETPKRSVITWSSLVSGYCKFGSDFESFYLFYQMQYEGYSPNQFTLGSILRLCSIKGLLSRGEQIHGYSVKTSFDMDVYVVTSLIDVYAKCSCLVEAEYLFSGMSKGKNHVTWTAMINGYSLNGNAIGAIECFRCMRAEGIEANQYTFPGVLTACGVVSNLGFGAQVHNCILRGGFVANVFVQSALVDMYTKCGDLINALKVVESMETDDAISWNALIVGCVRNGYPEKALFLFKTMHKKDMELDEFTYPSVFNSLASTKDVKNGMSLHCLVIKSGFEGCRLVTNALIDMHAKQSNLDCAFKLFNLLEEKDVISWTSLITGCAHNCCHEEALMLFCKMRRDGTEPDRFVAASVLSSCTELTLLDLGRQVHGNSIKSGFDTSLSVNNSLVALYANCGCLENAKKVFNSTEIRNVISWTALIVGYAQNGEGVVSLGLYDEMLVSGIKPDFITFIGLLFACSHGGLTELGQYYYDSMVKDFGIIPGPDHYACMIDLLSRSGKIEEAKDLLSKMPMKPDATVWKSLLASCRVHKNIDLAKKAANALFELEPQNAAPYVLLSNIYSSTGKWEEAASVRRLMKSRGVGKEPGRSWIEMNGTVSTFMSEDRSHVEADEIYSKVDEMIMLIREAGYVPDVSFALHDINEENKERGLAFHSEKLAVAFGLLYVPKGAPVRVYKNIRVCGDCHAAMKFVSQVYQRHIILRDSNCFHHFREGMCSCRDYW